MEIQRFYNAKMFGEKNDVSKGETVTAKVHEAHSLRCLLVLIESPEHRAGSHVPFPKYTNKTTTTNTESLMIFEVLACSSHKCHGF